MEHFSVLMSVYGKENALSLDKALYSVLINQTVKPTEIILVEDGPLTDELYRVIKKYKNIFPHFQSIKLPHNQGLGIALNIGLKQCHNDWIARMDSDDISLPQRFEKQLQYLTVHPETDVLGCAIGEFEYDENKIDSLKICPKIIDNYIKLRSPVNHPTVFFRKSSVLKAGGYQHCYHMEDYHLWIRMHAMGMHITSLQEVLYLFKMNTNTQKRRGGWQYIQSELEIQKLMLNLHIITIPRYIFNLIIRCTGKILNQNLRTFIYKKLLRKARTSYTSAA